MKSSLINIAIGVMAVTGMASSYAQTAANALTTPPSWRLAAAADICDASLLAVEEKENILVWTNDGKDTIAPKVFLVIDAPFAAVQPTVQKALEKLGRFEYRSAISTLAAQPDGWSEVFLSRRADLRDDLVEHQVEPSLQLAFEQGELTAGEMKQRLEQARNQVNYTPLDGVAQSAFQATYQEFFASQNRSYGVLRGWHSELSVYVADVSAAFGHPATAVSIKRADTFPNPDFSTLKVLKTLRDFNPLGNPVLSRKANGQVVPATVFEAIRQALISASPDKSVSIAASASAWTLPLETALPRPEISLTAAAIDSPKLAAESIPWAAVSNMPHDLSYPLDLLPLPDGDLLLSAEVQGENGHVVKLWRLHHGDGHWTASPIWQGQRGARQLAISADGNTAWFTSKAADDRAILLHAYHVPSGKLSTYNPGLDRPEDTRWELTGNQLPAFIDHIDTSNAKYLSKGRLNLLQAVTAAPDTDGPWPFQIALSSPRQAVMGLDDVWPVRWRADKTLWVEDVSGLAELDASSGHVLRAIVLPQRSGTPKSSEASGMAPWAPAPLGSPEAGWIAAGFVLNGSMPPKIDGAPNSNDRFVGMHVVDLQDGHIRFSALLGRADTLKAAARSAHGQFLAIGSYATHPWGPRLALWDVAKGIAPVQLTSTSVYELYALAFSWNGADLWAMGSKELFHWRLPEALRDSSSPGSYPDQSKR